MPTQEKPPEEKSVEEEGSDIASLKKRLDALEQQQESPSLHSGLSEGHLQAREAYEVLIEFMVPIAIGAAAGWFLDDYFASKPLCTIIFVLLGLGAGFMNMFRRARGYGQVVGFARKNPPNDAE